MGITYNVTINVLDEIKQIIKTKIYEPEYKYPYILVNFLIPKNSTSLEINNTANDGYQTDYTVNFFDEEYQLILTKEFKDLYPVENIFKIEIPKKTHSLDYIITGTKLQEQLKPNYIDKCNRQSLMSLIFVGLGLDFAWPLFIFNAENFDTLNIGEEIYLKENVYLNQTFLDDEHIRFKSEEVSNSCENSILESETVSQNKDNKTNYCNLYSCLYKCKFNFKDCVVNNFVKNIKKIK